MNPTMTLAQIKAHGPCHLHDAPLDTVVSLGDIAAHYDAADAWWCVRALDWSDIAIRRKVISVLLLSVKRAAKHTKDQRVHDCATALGKWCAGDDSVDLQAARAETAAAWTAAAAARATQAETAAAEAAWTAAAATAEAAAAEAAWAAAWAAWAAEAARAVARAATAAWAAKTTEREQQKADLIAAFPPMHPYA